MFRLLDLYCGAGGAGTGYARAGFEVVGVDWKPQKRYPFTFVQGDAIEYLREHGHEFDAIHASPPCQAHSNITPDKSKHVDMIPITRQTLQQIGKPHIIENVPGAKKAMVNPVMLCGAQFDLKVYRHRFFESSFPLLTPEHIPHNDNTPPAGHGVSSRGFISVTSGGNSLKVNTNKNAGRRSGTYGISDRGFVSVCGHFSGIDYCRMAMGIDWMSSAELAQAIPPAYTEYLGKQLYSYLECQRSGIVDDRRLVQHSLFDLIAPAPDSRL